MKEGWRSMAERGKRGPNRSAAEVAQDRVDAEQRRWERASARLSKAREQMDEARQQMVEHEKRLTYLRADPALTTEEKPDPVEVPDDASA